MNARAFGLRDRLEALSYRIVPAKHVGKAAGRTVTTM